MRRPRTLPGWMHSLRHSRRWWRRCLSWRHRWVLRTGMCDTHASFQGQPKCSLPIGLRSKQSNALLLCTAGGTRVAHTTDPDPFNTFIHDLHSNTPSAWQVTSELRALCSYFDEEFDSRDPTRCDKGFATPHICPEHCRPEAPAAPPTSPPHAGILTLPAALRAAKHANHIPLLCI